MSEVGALDLDGEGIAVAVDAQPEARLDDREELVGAVRLVAWVGGDLPLGGVDRAGHVVGACGFVAATLRDHLVGELHFDLRSRRALADEIAREGVVGG